MTKSTLIIVVILMAVLILLVFLNNAPRRNPGAYEHPSNELDYSIDYERNIICYSLRHSNYLSCVPLPAKDGGS